MKKNGIIFIALFLACSLTLTIGGCGNLKEQLEGAKAEVLKLTNENTVLKQKLESAESKIKKTYDDISQLESQCADLRAMSERLSEQKKKLLAKSEDLGKAVEKLEKELEAVRKENQGLNETIKELRENSLASGSGESTTQDQGRESAPTTPKDIEKETPVQSGDQTTTEPKEVAKDSAPTPCDMVISFMKSSSRAIRDLKGDERAMELERIAADYDSKMEGAPQEAITAAKNWVINLSKTWDKASSDGIFSTLDLRNKAIKACGISPEDSGF